MAALPMSDLGPMPDVYRAILQVSKALSRQGVGKNGKNQQQGYKFRGIDAIMNALSPLLAEAELVILPRMVSREMNERQAKDGKPLFAVSIHAHFAFVSARDGSRHTVATYGEAMDSADKATNKAMAAAYKYACVQAFCIPLEGSDDADSTTHEVRPPQPAVATIDGLPEYEYEEAPMEEEPSQLQQQLAGTLHMVQAFADMKARYDAIQMGKTYYAFLGLHGRRDAAFTDRSAASECFKEMLADIRVREAKLRAC